MRVFKQFFIKLNLPVSVVRGERFSVQVMVYNHMSKIQDVEVTLHNPHGDLTFVQATAKDDFSSQSSNSISRRKLVRVAAQNSAGVSFLVTCSRLGEVNLKTTASSHLAGDGVVRSLRVKAEGEIQHRNEARLLHLVPKTVSSTGYRNNTDFSAASSAPKMAKQTVSVHLPEDAIPGSAVLKLSLLGDLLGTCMHNLQDLVRLPYGCGEQNMIHFVPNILVLEYLQRSNR